MSQPDRSAPGFAKVLASLGARPWQTSAELSQVLGYDAGKTLLRLRKRGKLTRRVGERHYQAYEYALSEARMGVTRG